MSFGLLKSTDFARTVSESAVRWALGHEPQCRLDFLFSVAVTVAASSLSICYGLQQFSPIIDSPLPPHMASHVDQASNRFGLQLNRRREIFETMAAAEIKRIKAIRKVGDGYRRRASFGSQEKEFALRTAEVFGVHVSVVFAILDEGIREGWTTGANAAPLMPRPVF
ncbi:MAG: hypothetical protein PHU25_07520 [Deltaproteobacteria bacterium]|nr:hypothetical protein [Deltaproteobacteria bacterium]